MAAPAVDEVWLKWQKRVGAIALLAVIAIVAINLPLFRTKEIPTSVIGCYRAESAPGITVLRDKLVIDQNNMEPTSASYRRDNVGDAILTERPLMLKPGLKGQYNFFDDRAGGYIRPTSLRTLEISASNGVTVTYHRADCKVSTRP